MEELVAFSVAEVCRLTSLAKSFVYLEIKAGRLKARKAGTRTIILKGELDEYLQSLPIADTSSDS